MSRIALVIILFSIFSTKTFAKPSPELEASIKQIQAQIAILKYQTTSQDEQIAGYTKCQTEVTELTQKFQNDAELLIIQGNCLASEVKARKSADLGSIKQAKALFEKAISINDKALNGAGYTSLGVLYGRVPGWPVSFGDKKKAKKNFQKALSISSNDIDTNFLYGEFLINQKEYTQALKYLNIAKSSPARNRPIADAGRLKEIDKAIVQATNKL